MLEVRFVRTPLAPPASIRAQETRGRVLIEASEDHYTEAQVADLNSIFRGILDGGQWFQLWQGEIISMASEDDDGRVA